MQDIVKVRFLLFLLGLIVVPIGTLFVVLFAKGYRPDLKKGEITVTGLLVANSYPEGAQIYVNDKLTSATNATINLDPGYYTIVIKKDGYHPWKKQLVIQPEIVTRATAVLFPSVPTLKPITSLGAAAPILAPDGTKTAFLSPSRQQLYTLDLTESPLGLLNRDVKIAFDFKNLRVKIDNLLWSTDSHQILATASNSAYLIDSSNQQSISTFANPAQTIADWNLNKQTHEFQKISTLPVILQNILATAAADVVWSPQENKLLYTATASAAIPDQLKKPLAGSNTQKQERELIPGHIYIYDTEEDRNFEVDTIVSPTPTPKPLKNKKNLTPYRLPLTTNNGWFWFPTSSHIYRIDPNKITIKEYDNTNITLVYEGPLVGSFALPYPSAKQMLILANLNTTPAVGTTSAFPNLYALTLR